MKIEQIQIVFFFPFFFFSYFLFFFLTVLFFAAGGEPERKREDKSWPPRDSETTDTSQTVYSPEKKQMKSSQSRSSCYSFDDTRCGLRCEFPLITMDVSVKQMVKFILQI